MTISSAPSAARTRSADAAWDSVTRSITIDMAISAEPMMAKNPSTTITAASMNPPWPRGRVHRNAVFRRVSERLVMTPPIR